jgi:hypothetical protein
LFRDELKAQDNCNPDILIEQEGKDKTHTKQNMLTTIILILVMMTKVMAKSGTKNIN